MILVSRKEICRFGNEFAFVDVDVLRRLKKGCFVFYLFWWQYSSSGKTCFKSLPSSNSWRKDTICITLLICFIIYFSTFRIYFCARIGADICALTFSFDFLIFIRNFFLFWMGFCFYFVRMMICKFFVRCVNSFCCFNDILVRSYIFEYWFFIFFWVINVT